VPLTTLDFLERAETVFADRIAVVDEPDPPGGGLGSFTYAELENYLTKGPETVSPALAMRIERLMRGSEHKRTLAPAPGAD